MVERGGLNYPIKVRDEFSAVTKRFRKEIKASKKAFREFQAELKRGKASTKAIRDQVRATESLGKARKATQKPLSEAERFEKKRQQTLRNLRDQTKLLSDAEVRASRIRKQTSADAERTIRNRAKVAERVRIQEQKAIERARIQAQKVAERARIQEQKATERAAKVVKRIRIQEQKATERAAKVVERVRIREQKASDLRDPRIQAQKQLNAERFKELVILKKIELVRAQARAQFRGGDIIGGRETLRRAKDLEKSLKGSAKAGNNLLFTFRRLVGTLAIFTLARKGVQVFNELVSAGLRFNNTIESSTLGIAGLVATLADVRDGLGQSVSAAEELDLALGLARGQIELLRQDSLKTVATFSQLLDTFQVAVGPGLAAGLNLDEVRKLTVQISQAAAALSVPQNQLAEEIRSLLAGTIQARTTRIATALGITNADIRALKETGELFDFLEARLEGFAESSKRAARQTLTGLQSILKGAFEALVGEAAEPLFKELLAFGNDLIDNILTVSDALDNLRPNPKLVSALRPIFTTLRLMLRAAVDVGGALGFEGAETVITTLASAFQIITEALRTIGVFLAQIVKPVTFFREQLDLGEESTELLNKGLGRTLGIITLIVLSLKVLSTKLFATVAAAAPLAAILFAVAKAIEFGIEKIFDVDLSIRQTISLITLGLFGAWIKVVEVVKVLGVAVTTSITNALDAVIAAAKDKALGARIFIAALFGDDEEAQRLATQRGDEELAAEQRIFKRRQLSAGLIAKIRAKAAERQLAVEKEIADLIGEQAGRDAEGPGFDASAEARRAAEEAAKLLTAIASTADKPINDLSKDLLKLSDNLRETRAQFRQGIAVEGIGGGVQEIFREAELERAEKLRAITGEIEKTREKLGKLIDAELITEERLAVIAEARGIVDPEQRIAALEGLDLTEAEALLVSLLTDEVDLRDGLEQFQQRSIDLAIAKAAVLINQELPGLREEVRLLQAEANAVTTLAGLQENNASAAQITLATARSAVVQAQIELTIARQRAVENLKAAQGAAQFARQRATTLATELNQKDQVTDKERDAVKAAQEAADLAEAILGPLADRLELEIAIAEARGRSLEKAREEAALVADGSLTQGLREGFMQFSQEFASTFNAGIAIARESTMALASFISQEIINAFDPTVDTTIKERFARLMQQIGKIILQQLIQTTIAAGLQRIFQKTVEKNLEFLEDQKRNAANLLAENTIGAARVSFELQIAAIRAASRVGGAHEGGLVTGFHDGGAVAAGVRGYALGGTVTASSSTRPRGLHSADTIRAFLAPGEFVMRRAAVEKIGLATLNAMNNGPANVVGGAEGGTQGFQEGGLVADRVQAQAENGTSEDEDRPAFVMVPAIAANDREMDQLTAGGANALMAFMRERAGDINTALDRSAGR